MTVANASGNLASYAYTLGASGNRTSVTEASGRIVNYVYDDLYRLTSETIANANNNGTIAYNYDAVGNRLQRTSSVNQVANQSSTYDANDRLNSDAYDANGNTKISNGKSYNYDFENKLISTSDGITIVYDGDGNRVSKTANGVTTNYLVDTNNLTGYAQVVEEIQGGNVVKAYTYGLDLISQRQASGVSFYNYDGHGSVRGLSNLNGSLTDTYDYDAFGNLINRTGTTDNNYLYAGEQFDADLGFYYNRARYLNVQTGRFISQDSYEGNNEDPISLHKYLYANADGVNKFDPSGRFSIAEAIIVVAIVAIVATMPGCSVNTSSNFPSIRILEENLRYGKKYGLYKAIKGVVTGENAANEYVIIQWIMGTATMNGAIVTLQDKHLDKYPAPYDFPYWTPDGRSVSDVSYPFQTRAGSDYIYFQDSAGVKVIPGDELPSGTSIELNLQFITAVYRKSDFPFMGVPRLADVRDPWHPAPVTSHAWNAIGVFVSP